jgi:IclR family transcriptional regulator, pca regulon regulatory protein
VSTDNVQSLERGLLVITAFSSEFPRLTLAQTAHRTGLTRATARRLLLTLQSLGYARSDGRVFELTPKVLDLGFAYLSSLDLGRIAELDMKTLVERTNESCSAAVLDGTDIVYVTRVPTTTRILTISLGIGSRLPAFCTSMGRVLLADLEDEEAAARLSGVERPQFTPRTITGIDELRAQLELVRRQGWAMVDQEREVGVRSIAAPLRDRSGRAVAAINISSSAERVKVKQLRDEFLPALLETAARIGERLIQRS